MVPPKAFPPGAAAFAGGGFAAGAVSAATGALAAKAVSDRSERRAIEERLQEVKRHLGSERKIRYGEVLHLLYVLLYNYIYIYSAPCSIYTYI